MTEAGDQNYRRELVTRLLPYMALSAIKVGIFTSPLTLIANAATKYNEEAATATDKVSDFLSLLPGVEKLKMEVVGMGAVSLVLERRDIGVCAEQYLRRVFKVEGSEGAPRGGPHRGGEGPGYDFCLRLPAKTVYLKLLKTLYDEDIPRYREGLRKFNPAEFWIMADNGRMLDERLDPIFVSENKVFRGRLKAMKTADMLYESFDRRFRVEMAPEGDDSVKLVLRLLRQSSL